jgi:hypothetical protein
VTHSRQGDVRGDVNDFSRIPAKTVGGGASFRVMMRRSWPRAGAWRASRADVARSGADAWRWDQRRLALLARVSARLPGIRSPGRRTTSRWPPSAAARRSTGQRLPRTRGSWVSRAHDLRSGQGSEAGRPGGRRWWPDSKIAGERCAGEPSWPLGRGGRRCGRGGDGGAAVHAGLAALVACRARRGGICAGGLVSSRARPDGLAKLAQQSGSRFPSQLAGQRDQITAAYRRADPARSTEDVELAMFTDQEMCVPALRLAPAQSRWRPTYVYEFDWRPPADLGTVHPIELPQSLMGGHGGAWPGRRRASRCWRMRFDGLRGSRGPGTLWRLPLAGGQRG